MSAISKAEFLTRLYPSTSTSSSAPSTGAAAALKDLLTLEELEALAKEGEERHEKELETLAENIAGAKKQHEQQLARIAEARANLETAPPLGAEDLTTQEAAKQRTRASLSLLRPPAPLSDTCTRSQFRDFLSEMKVYLANGRLTLAAQPHIVNAWLPTVIKEFIKSRYGVTPT